jgi:hypothetical protein
MTILTPRHDEKITGQTLVPPQGGDVMRHKIRLVVVMFILVALAAPLSAQASVVGRFSLITGEVDLLKGGKLPAVTAKVQDGVEPGDIIRTKSKAKAQLTMVDDSIITLAPESRLAIADYQYNPAPQERRAVVRLFRGLVHTVVNRIIKTEEPDFLMETHTAVIGVRGTNFYTLVGPSLTVTYLADGKLGVSSNLSTLPALLPLHTMQFTQIPAGKQPLMAQTLTREMLAMLERLMDTGLTGSGFEFGSPAPGTGGQYQYPLTLPASPDQKILQETIPPLLQPAPPPPQQPPSFHAPSVGPSPPGPSPGQLQ